MDRGEFSLPAIVLSIEGVGVGTAVYLNPRLGLAVAAAVAVVTLTYTLMRKSERDISLNGGGEGQAEMWRCCQIAGGGPLAAAATQTARTSSSCRTETSQSSVGIVRPQLQSARSTAQTARAGGRPRGRSGLTEASIERGSE